MAIGIPSVGLQIYTSPKVFSTSLKYLAFWLENKREFTPFVANGRTHHVHRFYPTGPYRRPDRDRYEHVVAFVRNPLDRLVSAYRNRVLVRREQSGNDWRRAVLRGLPAEPSFSEFVSRLDKYREQISEISHHTTPQVDFLGPDLHVYDKVFAAETLADFETFVTDLAGEKVKLPNEQRSARTEPIVVNPQTRAQVHSFYRVDYTALGNYLSPDSALDQVGSDAGPFRQSS